MALYPWVKLAAIFGQDMGQFPRVSAWLERIAARPAVQKGFEVGAELRRPPPAAGSEALKTLFGQTAASIANEAKKQG